MQIIIYRVVTIYLVILSECEESVFPLRCPCCGALCAPWRQSACVAHRPLPLAQVASSATITRSHRSPRQFANWLAMTTKVVGVDDHIDPLSFRANAVSRGISRNCRKCGYNREIATPASRLAMTEAVGGWQRLSIHTCHLRAGSQ